MKNKNSVVAFILILIIDLFFPLSSTHGQKAPPVPADLISFQNPKTLTLSPKGDDILVKTKKAIPEKNEYSQTIWHISTGKNGTTEQIDFNNEIHSIEWFPKGDRIAYLASAGQRRQVFVKNLKTDSVRQITNERAGVRKFAIAPSGKQIGYTTIDIQTMAGARKKGRPNPDKGQEIDLLTYNAFQINNNRPPRGMRPKTLLKITDITGSDTENISETPTITQFSWSPSGTKIALIAKKPQMKSGVPTRGSDLYVYNLKSNNLNLVQEGAQKENRIFEGVVAYSIPFWSPSGNKLGFIREDYSDHWASIAELGVYNLKTERTQFLTSVDDKQIYQPQFHWLKEDEIFVEYTNRAKRGLYSLSVEDGELSPIKQTKQHQSHFSFSSEGTRVAWIQQSINQPPEIFVSKTSANTSRQISQLNESMNDLWLPEAESITWKSTDGTQVHGWYIKPKKEESDNPAPMITLVHGGPGMVVTNNYQPYLQQWPYPVQIFAANGYGVFIPNYRRTNSFGKAFKKTTAPDKEPVDDIITGIEHLISEEIADKNRLGIVGHSHGGWLGPIVAAKKPIFKAASFAEGIGNYLSLYGHYAGYRNVDLHEPTIGTNPYKSTERYLELSPSFRESFTKNIPTLIEYGKRSPVAAQGIELGKALWRHDTPHKLILYPQSGHSIRKPALQIDAMKQNLEWFNRWLSEN